MVNTGRDISKEFADNAGTDNRFYIHYYQDEPNDPLRDYFDTYSIPFSENGLLTQSVTIVDGKTDILYTSYEAGAEISLSSRKRRLLPFRMAYPEDLGCENALGLLNGVNTGTFGSLGYKNGSYGAVVFPRVQPFQNDPICIKYFNYAFPYSQPRRFGPKVSYRDWYLSGVTGVGNYIALRHLQSIGIKIPKLFLATSEILVQELINGYTLTEMHTRSPDICRELSISLEHLRALAENYRGKYLDLRKSAEALLEKNKGSYWTAYFQEFDLVDRNIMVSSNDIIEGNTNPDFIAIDPVR